MAALLATLRQQIREEYGCEPEDLPEPPEPPPKEELLAALTELWDMRGTMRFGQLMAMLVSSAEPTGKRPQDLYGIEDAYLLDAIRSHLAYAARPARSEPRKAAA